VKALDGVYGYVMQSSLPAVLVDLVYLRISQINNCVYCLDMHTRDLLKKGQKIKKVALVQAWAEGGNLFDERDRAALAWAETVLRVAETDVPDGAYQAARAVFEPSPADAHELSQWSDECTSILRRSLSPDSRLPTVSQTPPLNAGPISTTSTCRSKTRSGTWSGRREAGFMLAVRRGLNSPNWVAKE
jgi:AhpD family alkylhydroperoxidase